MIQSLRIDIAPDAERRVALVYDTVVDHKHVFTAAGLGQLHRGEPMATPAGAFTLDALTAHAELHHAPTVRIVEVATVAAAGIRVRKALAAADEKDALFFLCRASDVYDAVLVVLNVDPDTGAGRQRQ